MDELNADMSSSFRRLPAEGGEDVITNFVLELKL